jgi:beta-lactamase regulating signal transducer with metallopeptidase domain
VPGAEALWAAEAAAGGVGRIGQALLPVWLAGAVVAGGALLVGTLQLLEWRRRSRSVAEPWLVAACTEAVQALGLQRVPEVRMASWCRMPVVAGWRRGTVYLPEAAREWSPEMLRMVLLHELAHLKRRDTAMQALVHLACALHWFNPLVWQLRRLWLRERETACDALVLATGVAPRWYARQLVEIAAHCGSRMPAPAVAAAMAGPGLEQRVRSILAWQGRPAAAPRWAAASAALVGLGVMTAAATFLPVRPGLIPGTPASNAAAEAQRRLAADPFPAEPAE